MTTTTISPSRFFFLILILGALTALGPFSIDMYLPGFPAIAKDFGTDVTTIGFSLTSFFIGISAGQLLYGPLLDRYGRKRPLYAGLILYIAASIGCIYSHSIQSLIILRFFQAIGSCAATVAAVAMVRDIFPVQDNARVFALLMLVVGASPMVAPAVGGYITAAFGWHTVFLILTVLGILILVSSLLWLPESYQPDHSISLKPRPIITNFLAVLGNAQFTTYALAGACSFAGIFAYVSGSPKVFMELFSVSAKVYGWIFAGLSVGFIGCSQVNSILLRRFQSTQILPYALTFQSVFGILIAATAMLHLLTLPVLIVLLFGYLCCLGFVNPNTAALCLAPFSKNAGSASAVMGALQLGIGAITSAAVSAVKTPDAMPMAITLAACGITALAALLIGRRFIKSGTIQSAGNNVVLH
ncbi:multidrug effflux MFS transporter [Chitinophaga sp. Cy-1792]|uniref:multidrug effflux MFS transporter n=1 Tax=Chitinophaga sp. Cy-1792 TaxID=2608339 RepID=UPI002103CEED|nr:multidrug effflux MFS transporter [Chitinophaga sp. Cy-1792]